MNTTGWITMNKYEVIIAELEAERDELSLLIDKLRNHAAKKTNSIGTTESQSKGGLARAAKLTKERRVEIGRHAANVRWNNGTTDDHK